MDIYEGAEWTEMYIDDLRPRLNPESSIEEAAQFLCRADSIDESRANARSSA
jgi:hypothetical protein